MKFYVSALVGVIIKVISRNVLSSGKNVGTVVSSWYSCIELIQLYRVGAAVMLVQLY